MHISRLFYLTLILLLSLQAAAQNDSVQYKTGFRFKTGIYLTFQDFKKNNPIPLNNLKSDLDKSSSSFLKKYVENNTIEYISSPGTVKEVKVEEIWGYSDGLNVFVQYKSYYSDSRGAAPGVGRREFIRLNTIGRLSTYVKAYQIKDNSGGRFGSVTNNYVFDFRDGKHIELDEDYLEDLLKKEDQDLYKEFKKYKGKELEKLYVFVSRYNQKYPIYISAGK